MSNVAVKGSNEVIAFNPPVSWIKEKIEAAGNTIGSVHFVKRGDGTLRKMSYRLHVKNPSVASVPKSEVIEDKVTKICTVCRGVNCKVGPWTEKIEKVAVKKPVRKEVDSKNKQITVLDANKVVRDDEGEVIGRGAYRTVPLENVVRITNRGTTYIINQYKK